MVLRSRVVLSVSARPRPMSREFDLPKEGRSLGFGLCDCSFNIANRLGVTGLRNSHAREKGEQKQSGNENGSED